MSFKLAKRPSVVDFHNARFLVLDPPSSSSIPTYCDVFVKKHVTHLVRCCEPSYDASPLVKAGITVEDMVFADGDIPNEALIGKWVSLVKRVFPNIHAEGSKKVIAIHCLSGNRAPTMVVIGLVELGLNARDAIDILTSKRHGIFSAKQVNFLLHYQPKSSSGHGCCVVM